MLSCRKYVCAYCSIVEKAVGLVPSWEDLSMQARAPPVMAEPLLYHMLITGTHTTLCRKEMVWGGNTPL